MYIPFNDIFHKVAGTRRQAGAPASNPFTVGQQAGTQFTAPATNSVGGGGSTSTPAANPPPVATPVQQSAPATTASPSPPAQTSSSTPPASSASAASATQSFVSSITTESSSIASTSTAPTLLSQTSPPSQTASSSASSSSSAPASSIDATTSDTKAGKVAGGVVGGIAGLAILLALLFLYFKARRSLKRRPASYGSLEPGKWRYSANSRNFKRVVEESNAREAMDQPEKFAYQHPGVGVSEPPPPIFAQHTTLGRGVGGSQDLRMNSNQEKSWYKKAPVTHYRKQSSNYYL